LRVLDERDPDQVRYFVVLIRGQRSVEVAEQAIERLVGVTPTARKMGRVTRHVTEQDMRK
jgi:hypothetical protein